MGTETLITADVVEILDTKILTTSAHPEIGIIAGQTLNEVLAAISGQELTPEQYAAFSNLLTTPSASNPVVLKDDLPTYYPLPIIGELKDAVPNFGDLPLSGNTVGDLRPVTNEGSIYRWTGAAWLIFIKAGTLDHTVLINQNSSASFQHLTVLEKASVVVQAHTHANLAVLDLIISAGSGSILTTNERNRIPTADEKAALIGTSGVPSSVNRYVTAIDPRLNTVRNPYITVGPLGSGATFNGTAKDIFDLAYSELISGAVKSIEVLPGTFDLSSGGDFTPLVWSDVSGMSLEAWSVGNSRIIVETFTSSLQFLPSLTPLLDGPVTIKGITFEMRSAGTEGVLIQRADTIVEDCVFQSAPGAVLGDMLKGLRIEAPRCVIRRCRFLGVLITGLEISAAGAEVHIEDCEFSLSASASTALKISANAVAVNGNTFNTGTTEIDNTANGTIFNENRYASTLSLVPVTDSGVCTRWLSNSPSSQGQPYLGVVRTVGPVGSYADFTGSTEAPFIEALADPRVRTIEVLPGAYIFSSPVTVPAGGYRIRSTTLDQDSVAIAATGVSCFILNSSSTIEGISLAALGANGIEIVAGASVIQFLRCEITQSSLGFYGLNAAAGCSDLTIHNSNFLGTQGVQLLGVNQRIRIRHSIFSTSGVPVSTSVTTSNSKMDSNIFQGALGADLKGTAWTVTENHFLAAIPTKINTVNSVWSKNWPAPVTNNDSGVDTIKINAARALGPLQGSGAEKTSFAGISVLAFVESASGVAVTLPIEIPNSAELNRNLGFTIELAWTAPVFSGNVQWQIEVVFRDALGLELGSPSAAQTVLSARTKLIPRAEDLAVFSFPNTAYGFIPGVNPTHVSLIVRRLADELAPPLDTMPGNAYLTALTLTLPRD